MNEGYTNNIRKHLEDENARQRVRKDMERVHEEATVTIGRAAELFGFSENQLRDWENRGFLNPRRSQGDRGQRLYAVSDLDKLALLKELLENGGYSIGNIPPKIDEIWHSIHSSSNAQHSNEQSTINFRVEKANAEEYWRYFISQALRLALSLIFEDVPHTTVGIILPLKRTENAVVNLDPQKLVELGECLISWRDQDHTFHTFYEAKPVFESPFDFRIRGLRAEYENEPKDRTFLILQGSTRILRISQEVVETVRLLLAVIYEESNTWLPYFAQGVSNTIYGTSALSNINNPYSIMMFLADMVVRLGGKTAEGKDRWKFCCVLIPRSLDLPFQMRTLVVQAQSSRSPHIIDETSISPEATILSLGLRAFQSIHMLFRSPISSLGYNDWLS